MSKRALRALAGNELIGLEVEVTGSGQRELVGLHGRVVDETMHTLVLETGGREKRIQKAGKAFRICFKEGAQEVPGEALIQRPEERLKKLWRKIR